MAISVHKQQLQMEAIAMKLFLCTLVLLAGQLPSQVSGTGGTMGPVVSLVDSTYGNLTTVCALESGSLLPVCIGALMAGTPTTQPMWALTAGAAFVCGLDYVLHTPACWGSDTLVTSIPTTYASTSYSTINAGSGHVCAVRDNDTLRPGTVDCWGDNSFQQGLPPPNVPMLSVSCGDYFTCGIILATKKVQCWGKISTTDMPSPSGNGQFKAIFSARLHMCGIRLDGYAECWSGFSIAFTNPNPTSLFSSLAGCYVYTCAVQQQNHQMICWSPVNISPMPIAYTISYISASASLIAENNSINHGYICGVREDIEVGNLYCVGTLPHSLADSLSSFSASKGICRDQCPEGQYPVLTEGQCPNTTHKVCLDCQGACPEPPLPSVSPPPIPNIVTTPPPPSESPSYTSAVSSPSPTSNLVVPISITVASVVLVAILIAILIVCYHRGIFCKVPLQEGSALIVFSPQQIRIAANNYTEIIGQGGFGIVYKGVLQDKQIVAIKKPLTLKAGGDYEVEFDMLYRLNHPSLVRLIGYCKRNNTLVFPYMENGTLRDRMVDPIARRPLSDTKRRVDIALQVAKGLQYIHESGVIHRDMKAANILLDGSWNAYIADFGISRLAPDGGATHCTTRVIGTTPYLDPDYYGSGELTYKSDVYSFGVVLLELGSGLGPIGLADNARSLHSNGRLSSLVDQNLLKIYRDCRLSLLELAIWCVQPSRADRPTMQQVVTKLEKLCSQL